MPLTTALLLENPSAGPGSTHHHLAHSCPALPGRFPSSSTISLVTPEASANPLPAILPMSVSSPDSPSAAGPTPASDESALPQGQCRYILLVPGIKGQRCGCAHFTLNHSTPGATCDCGHMACYHVKDKDPAPDNREVDLLKQRVHMLEEQIDRERQGGLGGMLARVSQLEELFDKSREDIGQEMRGSYRNITRVWQSVEQLEQRCLRLNEAFRSQADHFSRIDKEVREITNRQLELFDADLSLEERLDRIEAEEDDHASLDGKPLPPTPDDTPNMAPESSASDSYARPSSGTGDEGVRLPPPGVPAIKSQAARPAPSTTQGCGGPWTVHVSLLPSASQPFPFERDTNAYKRCLSRGLHRTIVVADSTGEAFQSAVRQSFRGILKDRSWMPLKAKICDVNQLRGLPMLRTLDAALVDGPYDMEFLQNHCAVRDPHGNIESLYLAMRHDTLPWRFLRDSPIVVDGLETCWAYDHYLDPSDPFECENDAEGGRPSATVAVPSLPSLKRGASEVSRSSSFGSASAGGDCEGAAGSHSKMRRTCYSGGFDLKRRVETV